LSAGSLVYFIYLAKTYEQERKDMKKGENARTGVSDSQQFPKQNMVLTCREAGAKAAADPARARRANVFMLVWIVA
jgi:hypothetical protein